jgi:hypothetical protein
MTGQYKDATDRMLDWQTKNPLRRVFCCLRKITGVDRICASLLGKTVELDQRLNCRALPVLDN